MCGREERRAGGESVVEEEEGGGVYLQSLNARQVHGVEEKRGGEKEGRGGVVMRGKDGDYCAIVPEIYSHSS